MQQIHAQYSASVTELKKNPTALVQDAQGSPVAIMNHNKPMAYLIPAQTYEAILDILEDNELVAIIESRKAEKPVRVDIDAL
ncbi:MAG: type II toxin-antitoxin system Phd/YefM family antitoxin [Gammaproteobacteria bacterium]